MLHTEIEAIQAMGARCRMFLKHTGEAFGSGCLDDGLVSPHAANFHFGICLEADGSLVLEVDGYCAIHGNAPEGGFDVDAWDAGKTVVRATPATRSTFRLLHRAARLMLKGRDVVVHGCYLSGVRP